MTEAAPNPLRPVQPPERIELLDVLRGFALAGIVVVNYQVFAGLLFMDPGALAALGMTTADRVTEFLIHLLLEQKFYSLFSLLFGIGFSIQMGRAADRGSAFAPFFRRRLAVLLGIGLLHAVLVWPGDILVLYSVLGFALLLFREASARTVLRWGVALLLSPIAIYALLIVLRVPDPMAAMAGSGPSPLARALAVFSGGSYPEVVATNAFMYVGRWVLYVVQLRIPRVLGMFLIGVWLDRRNVFRDPAGNRVLLARTALWGAAIGLSANAAVAWMGEGRPALPATGRGFLGLSLSAIGVPALALAYAAAIALAMKATRKTGWMSLAPMGRMALTQYLLQSVAGVLVFYGLGLGLLGRTRPLTATAIAMLVFAGQVVLSRLWMAHFAYGPAEWVWRRLTYAGPVPFLRRSSESRSQPPRSAAAS